MIRALTLSIMLAVAAGPASALSAQQWPPPIGTGTRVRLPGTTAESPVVGVMIGVVQDSLRLSIASGSATAAYPVKQLMWIDASEGRARARWMLGGITIGGLGGMLVGGYILGRQDPGFGALGGAIAGGILGAVGGGITGAIWAPERWTRHHNPR